MPLLSVVVEALTVPRITGPCNYHPRLAHPIKRNIAADCVGGGIYRVEVQFWPVTVQAVLVTVTGILVGEKEKPSINGVIM